MVKKLIKTKSDLESLIKMTRNKLLDRYHLFDDTEELHPIPDRTMSEHSLADRPSSALLETRFTSSQNLLERSDQSLETILLPRETQEVVSLKKLYSNTSAL